MNSILESPLVRQQRPWWIPLMMLGVTLFGILVQGWSLQPVIFLFWWETILMVGAALIRTFFALDGKQPADGVVPKLVTLGVGVFVGGTMVMLAVAFSFKAFETGSGSSGLEKIPLQSNALTAAYLIGLILHYFANGRYKTANPAMEMMRTLAHLLLILVFLMVITMHLLPAFPQWNQAHWVAVAVVVIKFGVDWLFTGLQSVESGSETLARAGEDARVGESSEQE